MFIGDKSIKDTSEDGDFRIVNFVDEAMPVRLHKDIYEKVVSEVENKGTVQDIVFYHLARKFLAELALYGMEFYAVEGVGTSMQVLAHNLREEEIAKKFNCKSPYNIRLVDILPI